MSPVEQPARLLAADLSRLDAAADVWRPRPLTVTRVYRFQLHDETLGAHDLVLPEHHVDGGGRTGNVRQEHRCSARCRPAVRLPVVGAEAALRLYADWWRLVCVVNGWSDQIAKTRIVEQSAFEAQEQVREQGWAPLPIFTETQAVATDMLIRADLVSGRPRWCYI